MIFTQEQINEIAERIAKKGKRDSQFEDVSFPLKGDEYLAIVQDKENKKIELHDLLDKIDNLKVDLFNEGNYNMNECLKPGIYYSCTEGKPTNEDTSDEQFALEVYNTGVTAPYENFYNYIQSWDPNNYYRLGRTSIFQEVYYGAAYREQQTTIAEGSISVSEYAKYRITILAAANSTKERDTIFQNDFVSSNEALIIDVNDNIQYVPTTVIGTSMGSIDDFYTLTFEVFPVKGKFNDNVINIKLLVGQYGSANWYVFRVDKIEKLSSEAYITLKQICHSNLNIARKFERFVYLPDREYDLSEVVYTPWVLTSSNNNSNANKIASNVNQLQTELNSITNDINNSLDDINNRITTLDDNKQDKHLADAYSGGTVNRIYNGYHDIVADGDVYSAQYINEALESKADLIGGKIPADLLPSYVDDVEEYEFFTSFPEEGEKGKIYIDTSTNNTYRWSGSEYILIGSTDGIELGEEDGTAYEGSKGKANREDIDAYKEVVTISGDDKNTTFNAVTANTTTTFNDWVTFNKSPRVNANINVAGTAKIGAIKSNWINYKGAEIDDVYAKKSDVETRLLLIEENPRAEITISPSPIYAGELQRVTIKSTFATNSNYNAIHFVVTVDNNIVLDEDKEDTSATIVVPETYTSGSHSVNTIITYVINDVKEDVTKSTTFNAVYPIYSGFVSVLNSFSVSDLTKLSASTNPKTTYKGTSVKDNQYFVIAVPTNRDTLDITKFSMGGAPVAMDKLTNQTFRDIQYNVYYTKAQYKSNITLDITAY